MNLPKSLRTGPAIVLGLVSAGFVACVGENAPLESSPDASTQPGEDASSADAAQPVEDASTTDATQPTEDAAVDAPLTCEGGTVACATSCVDLQSDREHCGGCGHSCGGGVCDAGICQPFTVTEGLKQLHDVAFDAEYLYFTYDNVVQRCAKGSSCAGAERQTLADFSGQDDDGTGEIEVADGRVAFIGGTNGTSKWYACPVAGCASLSSMRAARDGFDALVAGGTTFHALPRSSGLATTSCTQEGCSVGSTRVPYANVRTPLAASSDAVYYAARVDSAIVGLARCANGEASCALGSTATLVTNVKTVQKLVATSTRLFFLWPGGPSGGSRIGHCPLAGCADAGAPSRVRDSINDWHDLTAHEDTVVWLDEAGKLNSCTVDGCAAPRQLADGLTQASGFVDDGRFVYWLENAGVFTPTGRIRAVAR